MIIVTGAAGFIGSCLVAELNARGHENLILVDHMPDDQKRPNIVHKKYQAYLDKHNFIEQIRSGTFEKSVETIFHLGACSSTTLQDADYFEENNYLYTRDLCTWAVNNNARFIYASSAATYGDGSKGYSDDHAVIPQCQPLNLYGESKQKFDQWALDQGYLDQIVGLKYFNVYGPNEYHKGDMRSVVAKAYQGVVDEGLMRLFKSYHPDYADGEQRRDFIYVKDAVRMTTFFMTNLAANGIFNIGTGQSRTWKDLAHALFAAVGTEPNIEFIEMPDILKDKYQYFTEANIDKIRQAGYAEEITSLEDAVKDYTTYLKGHTYF